MPKPPPDALSNHHRSALIDLARPSTERPRQSRAHVAMQTSIMSTDNKSLPPAPAAAGDDHVAALTLALRKSYTLGRNFDGGFESSEHSQQPLAAAQASVGLAHSVAGDSATTSYMPAAFGRSAQQSSVVSSFSDLHFAETRPLPVRSSEVDEAARALRAFSETIKKWSQVEKTLGPQPTAAIKRYSSQQKAQLYKVTVRLMRALQQNQRKLKEMESADSHQKSNDEEGKKRLEAQIRRFEHVLKRLKQLLVKCEDQQDSIFQGDVNNFTTCPSTDKTSNAAPPTRATSANNRPKRLPPKPPQMILVNSSHEPTADTDRLQWPSANPLAPAVSQRRQSADSAAVVKGLLQEVQGMRRLFDELNEDIREILVQENLTPRPATTDMLHDIKRTSLNRLHEQQGRLSSTGWPPRRHSRDHTTDWAGRMMAQQNNSHPHVSQNALLRASLSQMPPQLQQCMSPQTAPIAASHNYKQLSSGAAAAGAQRSRASAAALATTPAPPEKQSLAKVRPPPPSSIIPQTGLNLCASPSPSSPHRLSLTEQTPSSQVPTRSPTDSLRLSNSLQDFRSVESPLKRWSESYGEHSQLAMRLSMGGTSSPPSFSRDEMTPAFHTDLSNQLAAVHFAQTNSHDDRRAPSPLRRELELSPITSMPKPSTLAAVRSKGLLLEQPNVPQYKPLSPNHTEHLSPITTPPDWLSMAQAEQARTHTPATDRRQQEKQSSLDRRNLPEMPRRSQDRISPHSSHSPHLMSPQSMSPQLMSPHLMSPQLKSPQQMSPHLMSPHLAGPQQQSPPQMSPPQQMSPQQEQVPPVLALSTSKNASATNLAKMRASPLMAAMAYPQPMFEASAHGSVEGAASNPLAPHAITHSMDLQTTFRRPSPQDEPRPSFLSVERTATSHSSALSDRAHLQNQQQQQTLPRTYSVELKHTGQYSSIPQGPAAHTTMTMPAPLVPPREPNFVNSDANNLIAFKSAANNRQPYQLVDDDISSEERIINAIAKSGSGLS